MTEQHRAAIIMSTRRHLAWLVHPEFCRFSKTKRKLTGMMSLCSIMPSRRVAPKQPKRHVEDVRA